MRQRRDFRRYSVLRQGARDLLLPNGRAHQAFSKAVGLPQLEANAVDGLAKIGRPRLIAEGMQDALLVRRQIVGRAVGEPPQ